MVEVFSRSEPECDRIQAFLLFFQPVHERVPVVKASGDVHRPFFGSFKIKGHPAFCSDFGACNRFRRQLRDVVHRESYPPFIGCSQRVSGVRLPESVDDKPVDDFFSLSCYREGEHENIVIVSHEGVYFFKIFVGKCRPDEPYKMVRFVGENQLLIVEVGRFCLFHSRYFKVKPHIMRFFRLYWNKGQKAIY